MELFVTDEHTEYYLSLSTGTENETAFRTWRRHFKSIAQERTVPGGKNWLTTKFFFVVTYPILLPGNIIQNFIYSSVKRRAHRRWPEIVRERLRPDGPTTRLIDLERERGLDV